MSDEAVKVLCDLIERLSFTWMVLLLVKYWVDYVRGR